MGDINNYYFLGKAENSALQIEFVPQFIKSLLIEQIKNLNMLPQYKRKERENPNQRSFLIANKWYMNDNS